MQGYTWSCSLGLSHHGLPSRSVSEDKCADTNNCGAAGDHLYRMDYVDFVRKHRQSKADITVAALPMDQVRCRTPSRSAAVSVCGCWGDDRAKCRAGQVCVPLTYLARWSPSSSPYQSHVEHVIYSYWPTTSFDQPCLQPCGTPQDMHCRSFSTAWARLHACRNAAQAEFGTLLLPEHWFTPEACPTASPGMGVERGVALAVPVSN